ncbi:hypothetical protein GCM10007928_52410 [Sulfitobacter porphyrae]|nr:hypothetical protein GCM10007928_52410 [Sulfitobacter porphyrae]
MEIGVVEPGTITHHLNALTTVSDLLEEIKKSQEGDSEMEKIRQKISEGAGEPFQRNEDGSV